MHKRALLIWVSPVLLAAACGNGEASRQGGAAGAGIAGTGGGAAGATGGAGDGSGAAGTNNPTGAAGVGAAGADDSTGAAGVGPTEDGGAAGTGLAGATDGGGTVSVAALELTGAIPMGDQTKARKLYIVNNCTYDIWTFSLDSSNSHTFPNDAPFKVAAGEKYVFGWSNKFSGRVWGRSECTGTGGNLKCAETGNDTLAEFTLNQGKASDWYDMSLVDGFTIPTGIVQLDAAFTPDPTYVVGGKVANSRCASPVCAVDLDLNCPASQQRKDSAGKVVTCVNGMSTNGGAGPTPVTSYMKMGCPTSYTFPYDDPQSLFTCPSIEQNNGVGAKDYAVVYCPTQGATPGFY
jgi:thaumatin family protein